MHNTDRIRPPPLTHPHFSITTISLRSAPLAQSLRW